jgi:hypothetical protein
MKKGSNASKVARSLLISSGQPASQSAPSENASKQDELKNKQPASHERMTAWWLNR